MQLHRRLSFALAFLLAATLLPAQAPKKKGKKGKKAEASAVTPKASPTPAPKLDKIHPYLTIKGDTARSIVINWWNPEATGDSTVLYGPAASQDAAASYGATAHNPEQTRFHHVELKDLTPGTTYHYQIKSSDGTVGEDNTFTLPAENATDFTFAVCGDSRGNNKPDDLTIYNPRRKAEYDHIASKKPAFTINVGDIALTGANPGVFIQFFNCEQNCLKSAPYMIAVGNHEMGGPGAWPADFLYHPLFAPAYPTNGTPGDSGQSTPLGLNYSYDYGNAHLAFLASFKMTPKSEVEWLDRDLAAARANPKIKWVFVVMHSPLYTWASGHKGEEPELEAWGPIIDKHHVDIVFAGHNHIYERSNVIKAGKVVSDPSQGTIYMTCGLGGAPFHKEKPADPSYPFIKTAYNTETAASFVHIQGNKLEMKTMTTKDEVVDSFTIEKK